MEIMLINYEDTEMSEENTVDPIKEAIKAAFEAGIVADKKEDDIKLEMIKAGSSFKTIAKDYNDLMIASGLIDSKESRDKKVEEILTGADVSTEAPLNDAIAMIVHQVKGIDEKAALSAIRSWARKNEKVVWTKPKAEGGATRASFARSFYDALIANPAMTKEEADAIINGTDGHPETTDNVKANSSHYQSVRKLANAIADVVKASEEAEDDE